MPIFLWEGPEEELECACVVTKLVIDSIEEKDGRKFAKGRIWSKDYVEHGIEFNDPWGAEGIPNGTGFRWQVKRPKDGTEFWVHKETDEVFFTFNRTIERAMKVFIGNKINDFLRDGKPRVGPTKYTGPREKYQGECVCFMIAISHPNNPFPWQEKTNGGKFPERCFECSCGRRWWCIEPKTQRWFKVADPALWNLLLDHNGVPVQLIGDIGEGLMLFQTIRDKGYIPID